MARTLLPFAVLCSLAALPAQDTDATAAPKPDGPALQSIGPLAFAPGHQLLVSDPKAAVIFAVNVSDQKGAGIAPGSAPIELGKKLADMLGTTESQVRILDVAVNPATRQAYAAVVRGRGANAAPLIVRIDGDGELAELKLAGRSFTKAPIPNPVAATPAEGDGGRRRRGRRRRRNRRMESITDLACVKGSVIVAGLSNEEFASTLRTIPFPFDGTSKATSVEIFHGAHGRYETNAPVRTFVPYEMQSKLHLVAAYTCTPLVVFPVADLKPGAKVKGRTVAELGNRNRPLDMIAYTKNGKDYFLMANSSRGVMKIPADAMAGAEHIEERIRGKAGVAYETIADMKGVVQLDKLDDGHALVLARGNEGGASLLVVKLP